MITSARLGELQSLLWRGKTTKQIADHFCVSENAVRQWYSKRLEKNSYPIVCPRQVWKIKTVAIIHFMLDLGFSQAEIARQFGLNRATINYHKQTDPTALVIKETGDLRFEINDITYDTSGRLIPEGIYGATRDIPSGFILTNEGDGRKYSISKNGLRDCATIHNLDVFRN